MPGGRLTDEDRRRVAAGLAEGLGYAEIGRRLGRPASTIMREVTRNGGPDGYEPEQAHQATRHRARRRRQAQPPERPAPDSSYGRDPEAVQEVAESFTALIVEQGMPRMMARVLSCLYFTDSGILTAGDLVERLRVSPASVSHAVAYLEQQGLLRRERARGERRERYVVDEEIFVRSLLATQRMELAIAAAAQRAAKTLGDTTPAGARFGSTAELLHLASDALRQALEQWRQIADARSAERES